MEIRTLTSIRGTTLLPAATLPQTTSTSSVRALGTAGAWRGGRLVRVDRLVAPTAALQGGAIAGARFAKVCDQMVTDHPYSTQLGSASCSPPV